MKIYRIENTITNHGMWYKEDGTYDPFILKLTEGKSKHLPMEHHERYSEGGIKWFSGCDSVEMLKQWFSKQDVFELLQSGYGLYEFECSQYKQEENQTLFSREGIVNKHKIGMDTLWDIEGLNKERIVL